MPPTSTLPRAIALARVILFWVSVSYVFSAAMLGLARFRGQPVPTWAIAGWLTTGIAGVALSLVLAPQRSAVWVGLLIFLGPWMVYSLVEDTRRGYWPVALADIAGLGAIAYSLAICASDIWK